MLVFLRPTSTTVVRRHISFRVVDELSRDHGSDHRGLKVDRSRADFELHAVAIGIHTIASGLTRSGERTGACICSSESARIWVMCKPSRFQAAISIGSSGPGKS